MCCAKYSRHAVGLCAGQKRVTDQARKVGGAVIHPTCWLNASETLAASAFATALAASRSARQLTSAMRLRACHPAAAAAAAVVALAIVYVSLRRV